jgi:hypothetical protein
MRCVLSVPPLSPLTDPLLRQERARVDEALFPDEWENLGTQLRSQLHDPDQTPYVPLLPVFRAAQTTERMLGRARKVARRAAKIACKTTFVMAVEDEDEEKGKTREGKFGWSVGIGASPFPHLSPASFFPLFRDFASYLHSSNVR